MTRLSAGNTVLFAVGFLALTTAGCPRSDFDLGGINDAGKSGGGTAGAAGGGNGGAQRCGSRGLPQCDDDEYCSFPASASCGDADAPGVCKPKPEACTEEYAPVCGCDGKTYGNACAAASSGVSVRRQGECKDSGGETCGGLTGGGCEAGEYCKFALDAQCGAADQTGVCESMPEVCEDIYKPVCGCDDKTYANACEAAGAGVSVASEGECKNSGGGKSCGGFTLPNQQNTCAADEYCNYPVDAICGAADAPGQCTKKPTSCTFEYNPVCGCDGITYSNPCSAASEGVSVASMGECDGGGKSCGGFTPPDQQNTCADDEFCNYPIDAICGAADAPGKCTKKPDACTLQLAEVCGCDGNTYGNDCLAAAAGTSVAHTGACEATGQTCGGITGAGCPSGEYCNYPSDAQCGAADQTGTCAPIPGACTKEYRPVCGCDDKTYGNACMAAAAGVSIASEGECAANGATCGGLTGAGCPDGQFCNYPISAQCGAADQTGTCTDKPEVCTADYTPVCGCDDKTYGNACAAHVMGISVAAEGECK